MFSVTGVVNLQLLHVWFQVNIMTLTNHDEVNGHSADRGLHVKGIFPLWQTLFSVLLHITISYIFSVSRTGWGHFKMSFKKSVLKSFLTLHMYLESTIHILHWRKIEEFMCISLKRYFLVNIKSWHVVTTVRNKTVTEGFIKLTKTLASKMGINVAEPTLSILQNDVRYIYKLCHMNLHHSCFDFINAALPNISKGYMKWHKNEM